jgi:putative membrane-bound dehydrogenase-like protein
MLRSFFSRRPRRQSRLCSRALLKYSRTAFAVSLLVSIVACSSAPSEPPYSPEQALQTFQIQDGFHIELYAAEPDIVDPVAMEVDEYGRIYVVESSGYPLDTESGAGRVKLLVDTDGDGKPDRTTLFADKLTLPTGVMAWKKGILVTDAPYVLYLEDTNGDGKADIREPLLEGFAFTNPQHTVNNPVYGLDNWIYLAHEGFARAVVFSEKFGDAGSEIHFPGKPDGPRLPVQRRSVRFRPETFELEYLAGASQYGRGLDPWGQIFPHDNSNHSRHEVIAARYYERNPALRVGQSSHNMPDHNELYPITIHPRFEILTEAGQFTSACGLTRYLGGSFPAGFENVSFVAEPVHNVVHADVWSDEGSTFAARRKYDGKEFLASTDAWFRPVNFYVGPDGALYVLDYYREVIEHPEWTSAETYESDLIYHGKQLGRIYRIVPPVGLPPFRNIRLGDASDVELVEQLANPNIWWRRTAQRLLVERRRDGAVPELNRMVEQNRSALARVHALWTLEGLGWLDTAHVEQGLKDLDPGVRRNAIILAERRLGGQPDLINKLLALGDDKDPKVLLQLLLTLGYVDSPAARALRDQVLFANIEDRWVQIAALSWPASQAGSLFTKATGSQGLTSSQTPGREAFFRQVTEVIGAAGDSAAVRGLLAAVSGPAQPGTAQPGTARAGTAQASTAQASTAWWRAAALRGLADGLPAGGSSKQLPPAAYESLIRLAQTPQAELRAAALRVLEAAPPDASNRAFQAAVAQAVVQAQDGALEDQERADALALIALADPAARIEMLEGLLDSQQPEPVQTAAAKALARAGGEQPATFVLEHWKAMTAPVRTEAAEVFYGDDANTARLVDAIEQGTVQPWMLVFRHQRRLIMHNDPALRERARRLLTEPEQDRKAVVDQYQAALGGDGDAARGKQVYDRACSKCHRLAGGGKDVGPDLSTVQSRPASLLLVDILVPNKSIAQTFESYVVETADGRVLDGVIGPQGPTFVTLRRENGEEDVIQRGDIKTMRATNLSAMPADMETQVSQSEMVDLIRYIKTAR